MEIQKLQDGSIDQKENLLQLVKVIKMKNILIIISLIFVGYNSSGNEVDKAISAAISFTDGKPSEPLKLLENYAVESVNDSERRNEIETKILMHYSKANSRRAKDFFLPIT